MKQVAHTNPVTLPAVMKHSFSSGEWRGWAGAPGLWEGEAPGRWVPRDGAPEVTGCDREVSQESILFNKTRIIGNRQLPCGPEALSSFLLPASLCWAQPWPGPASKWP